jgi:hypothetical protein
VFCNVRHVTKMLFGMSLSGTVVLWSSVTCVSYVCLLCNIVKMVKEIMSLHYLSHVPNHNQFQSPSQKYCPFVLRWDCRGSVL